MKLIELLETDQMLQESLIDKLPQSLQRIVRAVPKIARTILLAAILGPGSITNVKAADVGEIYLMLDLVNKMNEEQALLFNQSLNLYLASRGENISNVSSRKQIIETGMLIFGISAGIDAVAHGTPLSGFALKANQQLEIKKLPSLERTLKIAGGDKDRATQMVIQNYIGSRNAPYYINFMKKADIVATALRDPDAFGREIQRLRQLETRVQQREIDRRMSELEQNREAAEQLGQLANRIGQSFGTTISPTHQRAPEEPTYRIEPNPLPGLGGQGYTIRGSNDSQYDVEPDSIPGISGQGYTIRKR